MRWIDRTPLLEGSPYRRAIRDFLNKTLPLHADLDAFCIDHFGELLRRFGDGWDLLSKQNLLLTAVPADQLLTALESHFADNSSALRGLSEVRKHLSPEELQRQASSTELERLCETRAALMSQGRTSLDLDISIRELKKQLRRLPQLRDGEILGERYKLLSLLGKGGFARVYQAYDLRLKTLVAVKVLHSESSDDQRSLGRFERGARQMEQLNHPHIVRVLGAPAEQDGFYYFVMEYLCGGDLARAVLAGMLNAIDKLRVILEVGSALQFAHQRQLIHRDVKPENILLDGNFHAKLADFDLVWAADTTGGTRSRAGMGTYLYAAPEQLIDASQVTTSVDIYGLAMLTIFILCGNIPPWFRDYRQDVLYRIPIDRQFHYLLDRATHPNPGYRPLLGEFLRTIGQFWPLENENQITAKIQLLNQQELSGVSTNEARGESAESTKSNLLVGSSHAQPESAAVKSTVTVAAAIPASGSTLDPVETGNRSPQKKPYLRMAGLASLSVVFTVVGYFGVAWLREPVPVDPNVAASKLLVEIDQDVQDKWWSNVLDKTSRLVGDPGLSSQLRDAAESKRRLATAEQSNKKAYDRFTGAARSGHYDSALKTFAEIPTDSVYYKSAHQDYNKIFLLFVESHLKSASDARLAGNCAEASAQVQMVLDIDPQQVRALDAKDRPCSSPLPASKESVRPATPVLLPKKVASAQPDRPEKFEKPEKLEAPKAGLVAPSGVDPEEVLTNAQSEFINGNNDKAIKLALSVANVSTLANRAWRIIGAAACRNKDLKLAGDAYRRLDPAARQYLIYTCQRGGIVQDGNRFKLSE